MARTAQRHTIRDVTSRHGIINIPSLMRDQFGVPAYADIIIWAWHKTDRKFDKTQITSRPLRKVDDINFGFKSDAKCAVEGCDKYAFIRCAHCGRHLCLKHFLDRQCFHRSGSNWQTVDDSFRQTSDFEVPPERPIEPVCRPFVDFGSNISSSTQSSRDQIAAPLEIDVSG